jgi:2'-5' RNA ligase
MRINKSEGKKNDQSLAICLSQWRQKHRGKDASDYSKYLEFSPGNGLEYYVLRIPKDATPPKEGDSLKLNGVDVIVHSVSTPDDIRKGRGGPAADSLEKAGIGWDVNCLPKGHKWLKQAGYFSSLMIRIADDFQVDIDKAKEEGLPSVFLGGYCEDGNKWREEIKKEFKEDFLFIDPYDPDWEAEDNIYNELAAILNVDHVIFYRGGRGTEKEKEFMKNTDSDYKSFGNLNELKDYLKSLSFRVAKKACISAYLRKIASHIIEVKKISKVAKLNGSYDYSSLQIQLPEDLSESVVTWGKDNIPEELLHNNEKETKGREDDIHVTLIFGIESPDYTESEEILEKEKSFDIRLGLVTAFKDDPDYDVIKIDVESSKLHQLHYKLRDKIKVNITHPSYFPHITVAYVKKDSSDNLIGNDFFRGKKFIVSNVVFSSKNGNKKVIEIGR